MASEIRVFTDGGCRGNPGIGGWGALIITTIGGNSSEIELRGNAKISTNNQMELTAAIMALKAIEGSQEITLHTDSRYVMDGINQWIEGWKKKNWKTANKKPVKNKELWIELDEQNSRHNVKWCWVKGHSGDYGNERADALANLAMDEIQCNC